MGVGSSKKHHQKVTKVTTEVIPHNLSKSPSQQSISDQTQPNSPAQKVSGYLEKQYFCLKCEERWTPAELRDDDRGENCKNCGTLCYRRPTMTRHQLFKLKYPNFYKDKKVQLVA